MFPVCLLPKCNASRQVQFRQVQTGSSLTQRMKRSLRRLLVEITSQISEHKVNNIMWRISHALLAVTKLKLHWPSTYQRYNRKQVIFNFRVRFKIMKNTEKSLKFRNKQDYLNRENHRIFHALYSYRQHNVFLRMQSRTAIW